MLIEGTAFASLARNNNYYSIIHIIRKYNIANLNINSSIFYTILSLLFLRGYDFISKMEVDKNVFIPEEVDSVLTIDNG